MKFTRKAAALGAAALLVVGGGLVGSVSPAAADGETFEVLSVDATGCASGEFGMTVERANLDGGTYTVRTVVTVDDLVYMNEDASISVNGPSSWNIFDNFTYGPVPNPGTFPIPAGEMTLNFTLERPKGTVLYAWTLIVDGCATGNILANGPGEITRPPVTRPPGGLPDVTTTTATSTTVPETTTTVAPSTTVTVPPTVPTTVPAPTTVAPTPTTARPRPTGVAPAAVPVAGRANFTG